MSIQPLDLHIKFDSITREVHITNVNQNYILGPLLGGTPSCQGAE